jgi:hypothetical protein
MLLHNKKQCDILSAVICIFCQDKSKYFLRGIFYYEKRESQSNK